MAREVKKKDKKPTAAEKKKMEALLKKKGVKVALKKIGGGVAVGDDYKPGKDKALDAALKNILGGKVKDSSGIGVKW